jgi:hypothetical protein
MQTAEARELLNVVRAASKSCLNALGIPTSPIGKTRSWRGGKPSGVMFHYTGGVSALTAMRWFNADAGNTSSSCHFIGLGERHPRIVELWKATEAAAVFALPMIQLAGLAIGQTIGALVLSCGIAATTVTRAWWVGWLRWARLGAPMTAACSSLIGVSRLRAR